MSIKVKITIAIATVTILAVGCGIGVLVAEEKAADTRKEARQAADLVVQIFRLNVLRGDYLVFRNERSLQQWRTQLAAFEKTLKRVEFTGKEETRLLEHMRSDHRERLSLATELVDNYQAMLAGKKDTAEAERIDRLLVNKLLRRAYSSVDTARQIESLAQARVRTAERTAAIFVGLLVFVAVMGVAVISLLLARVMLRGLGRLTAGTDAVAAGDLDYVIGTRSRDEFDQLASRFNLMTSELREARSKDELRHDEMEKAVAERTAELKSAKERLEAANQELETYGRTVSHDLRGPISTALASNQMIEDSLAQVDDDELREDLLESAGFVRRNLQRAIRLAGDLLTLARAGQVPESVSDVDVSTVVRQVMVERGPEIKEMGVDVEVDKGLGTLRGNETQIYQLFSNLIGNAVRHNDCENPVVQVRYLGREEDAQRYLVRDNGSGIPEAELESIFQPFYRRGSGGDKGVGLSIVKKIVEVYGGSIRAYNDNGACFELSLKGIAPE